MFAAGIFIAKKGDMGLINTTPVSLGSSDISNSIDTSTSEYTVNSIRLSFTRDGMKIRYTCTCDVTFYVRLFGINMPATAKSVQVEGSHTAKYR